MHVFSSIKILKHGSNNFSFSRSYAVAKCCTSACCSFAVAYENIPQIYMCTLPQRNGYHEHYKKENASVSKDYPDSRK